MGLYALPEPADGVLVLLVVKTALSISLLRHAVRSLLHVVGLHRGSSAPAAGPEGESLAGRFRRRIKPDRFGTDREARSVVDCRVCLARFEPESVVDRLPCGHLFHGACLERWLDYCHVTCPLCRTRLIPAGEDDSSSWPWC